MDEKCPGCGAKIQTVKGIGTEWVTVIYTCGTGEESGFYGRECWANQCAVLKALVREMGLFTRDVFNHQLPKLGGDYIWSLHRQAEEILNHSEVKKIMEDV